MVVDEARKATLALIGSSDESDVAYIDEDLLAEYVDAREWTKDEEQEDLEPPEGAPEVARASFVVYGNSLVAGPERGRLHFRNGSKNRPNDPCGNIYRRWVQMTPGSQINPFRRCAGFTGYQIVVL